jgi:hypothetical protein
MKEPDKMTPVQIHLKLEGYEISKGQVMESCLTAALREARQLTGRDKSSGQADPKNTTGNLGSWSGAMCYLTILDQIGKCYRPTSKTKAKKGSSIERTLSYFTDLSEDEIIAIVALRNAFFHDFSLYNHNTSNQKLQHFFSVDNHPTNRVVRLPAQSWNGKMSTRAKENNTYINLKTLGDLVEEIYKDLIKLESEKKLSLELPGGENELTNRYTYIHS